MHTFHIKKNPIIFSYFIYGCFLSLLFPGDLTFLLKILTISNLYFPVKIMKQAIVNFLACIHNYKNLHFLEMCFFIVLFLIWQKTCLLIHPIIFCLFVKIKPKVDKLRFSNEYFSVLSYLEMISIFNEYPSYNLT